MPHLDRLWSEVSKDRKDVVFLAINQGDEADVIRNYWSEGKFSLTPVRQEGGTVSEAFGVQAYPTNYVIGADGKVLWRSVGWDEKAVTKAIAGTAKPAAEK